jgi:hypothetical protein
LQKDSPHREVAEMSYRVMLLVFLGIELVGGIALFADAGMRLLRERRR